MGTQSGQIIIPHDDHPGASRSGQQQTPGVDASSSKPVQPQPAARIEQPAPATPLESQPPQASLPAAQADWQYSQEADSADIPLLPDDVTWSASEFIEHPKNAGWYGLLALATLALATLDYILTRDVVSTVVIVVTAALFGSYAGRKPRTRQYRLSPRGLQIGEKTYDFQSFKAFSVTEEGAIANIVFIPLARFAPALTIYVASDIEQKILDYLNNFLPSEPHRSDMVDGLLRRIRF